MINKDCADSAPVIAIDGPSGSGKGTVAMLLADKLGWHLLDSGALYRLVAVSVLEGDIDIKDEAAVGKLSRDMDIEFRPGSSGETLILLEGRDVSNLIRTQLASDMASRVAEITAVREGLRACQRRFRRPPGLVADGRDMGTVIFPDAELKIFLTASVEERAKRRYKQLKEKGESVNLARLFREIEDRDARDSNRPIAPLTPATDSVIVDSTGWGIDETLDHVYQLLLDRNLTS